jgi:LuxR family maltose regulon positive regulatory protein
MLRSSVLGRLSGPLCDAVLEREDSAEMLDGLSRTNLFLVPLDDEHGWYRFHHLFGQLLRAELERRDPGLAPTLRCRASVWHRQHGTAMEAIRYAIEAGAFPEAGELIAASWPRFANAGRYATVLQWLRQFPDEALQRDVPLLLAKVWVLSLSAQQQEAAQVIATVERLGDLGRGPLPDGFGSVEASLMTLRGVFPWGDTGAQLAAGRRAAELEGDGSLWRSLTDWGVGMALYLRGEADEADSWFEEAATLAPLSNQWFAACSSLAHRSLIAGERGWLEEQRLLGERAADLSREHGLENLDGATHLARGMSLAASGRLEEALQATERGAVVLKAWGQPTGLAYALLCQASVLRDLGRCDRLQAVVSETRSVLERCPDPGILPELLAVLERAWHGPAEGGGELTAGELRVLRLLGSALSERDIGAELYVSYNTVHSHIRSIYRKLEVSSRADAVARASSLGLLQPSDSPR